MGVCSPSCGSKGCPFHGSFKVHHQNSTIQSIQKLGVCKGVFPLVDLFVCFFPFTTLKEKKLKHGGVLTIMWLQGLPISWLIQGTPPKQHNKFNSKTGCVNFF